jgi:hypothetical protein
MLANYLNSMPRKVKATSGDLTSDVVKLTVQRRGKTFTNILLNEKSLQLGDMLTYSITDSYKS